MMGTRTGSGPLDRDFERGIDVLRAAYAKKVNTQEAEVSHLKNELARRDSRIKDLQVKVVQLEGQLVKGDKKIQELTRAVNKLNNFKQTVMESFADVAEDLPADFSAKQKGMIPDNNGPLHPKDELDIAKEEPSSIRHVVSPSPDSLRFQRFEVYENSPKQSGGYLGQSDEDVLNSIQHLSAPSSPTKITGPAGRDSGSHDEDGEGEQVTTPHRRSAVTIGKSRPRRLERSSSRQEMRAVEDLPSSTTAVLGKPPPHRNRSPSARRRRDSSLPRRSPTPTASSARRHSTPASVAKPALRHHHHHHQYHHENYAHDVEYDSSNAANDSSSGGGVAGGGAGGDAGRRTPLSGSGGGGGGAASVDGREFFRMARGVLSYDEFTNLLWNVKAYNNREQSRQRTFDALQQLFGRKHPELFAQFEKMWSQ